MNRDETTYDMGRVKSVSDPFKMDKTSLHLITVETERGLFSLPVSNLDRYCINQKLEIYLTIRSERMK